MLASAHEPTSAVLRPRAGRPYCWGARVSRQDGVGGGQLIDHPGDVLRMAAGPRPDGRQLIETHAGLGVVFPGRLQMPVVLVLRELGQQRAERGFRIADETEVDLGAPA